MKRRIDFVEKRNRCIRNDFQWFEIYVGGGPFDYHKNYFMLAYNSVTKVSMEELKYYTRMWELGVI